MKAIGIIIGLIIFIAMGLIPIVCLSDIHFTYPIHFKIIYLSIFFIINIFVWVYFAIKFGIWFESNLKEKEK